MPAARSTGLEVEQEFWQLSHRIDFGTVQLSTIAYKTDTARVWFKLQDVFNADGQARSLSNVLQFPTNPDNVSALGLFSGARTAPWGALRVRSNNRVSIFSEGVQSVLTSDFATGAIGHALEFSVRLSQGRRRSVSSRMTASP